MVTGNIYALQGCIERGTLSREQTEHRITPRRETSNSDVVPLRNQISFVFKNPIQNFNVYLRVLSAILMSRAEYSNNLSLE
jgi:hypothetical protein